jgi:hypothetical protein
MILESAGLDAMEVDALQTDRYLDALLAAVERRAVDVPADPAVDASLRLAARRLRDELVRVHPSFRFEERLARRLADAAARMQLATAAGAEAEAAIIPFPAPLLADPTRAPSPFRPAIARPLLVRGALTSAALSLAGAAFVAWRLTRGAPTDPMARAVRAARAARAAATAIPAPSTAAATAADTALGHGGLA